MFWEIEEIEKKNDNITDDKVADRFLNWEEKSIDYFHINYINKIKFIMEKISESIFYFDGTKNFSILKNPKPNYDEFVFMYGNLLLVRENFVFTNFYFIHNLSFIQPYGWQNYIFGVVAYMTHDVRDLQTYFLKNKLIIDKFEKCDDGIKFILTHEYTRKVEKYIFLYSDFDFEDLENPNRIVKFKF